MGTEFLLEMKSINKSFGGVQALRDLSINLKSGEILGLVGDNAAGKSTLMKILTGFHQADTGTIYINGKKIVIDSPRVSKRLGIEMVYQDLELCKNLSVTENLFLGKELMRDRFFKFLYRKRMDTKTIEILHSLQIEIENPRRKVDKLSGGQQQAVAIGKAVSFNPRILILDEPTASLAVKEIQKVLDLVARLKNQGISVIMISHRLSDIFIVADRIFVLKHGEIVAVRETCDTNQDEIVKHMFVGTGNNGEREGYDEA